jgi:PKD repeat protein
MRRFTLLLLAFVFASTPITVHTCLGALPGDISIAASATKVTIGENVSISGAINFTLEGENVTIWCRRIEDSWGILATVITNGTGHYSYVWKAAAVGTHEFKATWIGKIDDVTYAAESSIITVKVMAPPVASFTYTPDAPTIDETVTFDASASYDPDGTIVSYSWDFGDGAPGTGVTTAHAYTTAESYIVTLTVTDNDTLTSNATSEIMVSSALEPPVASFTYSPAEPQVDKTVTFNASASHDPDGTIVSYSWDFGDGTNATGMTVDHAYADNGTYTVTLNVTDDDGLSDTTSKGVTVLNRPPNATFTESADTVYTRETITFNASESYDLDGSIVTYFWDFGDGTNATGVLVEHAYADNGTYTVTLTVTDDDGATDSTTATKTVLNHPPVAGFTESVEVAYIHETIYFNASESYDPDGAIVGYRWDFGDTTNATGVTAEHSYSQKGNYTVTLTVTDDDGATDTATVVTRVLSRPPVAMFTASAETVYTDEVITFNASDSYDPDGAIVAYLWDFGDGTDATGITVNHAYEDDGNYTVTLTVTDDDGETASKSAVETILNRSPIALFTENATVVNIEELIRFNASGSYDPDGSILGYFWDFGDGTNASMTVVLDHVYEEAGNYTVTLTVTDDDGASSSKSVTITAKALPGWPMASIAGLALGIAALTGTGTYAVYRRRKKSAKAVAELEKKPGVTPQVPGKSVCLKCGRERDKLMDGLCFDCWLTEITAKREQR